MFRHTVCVQVRMRHRLRLLDAILAEVATEKLPLESVTSASLSAALVL